MTARPVDPENRRRPVYAAVALVLVMVAVLLAVGCIGWLGGKYYHDQNVLITKMNPDGIVVWTKLIDSGKYDYALDFIETSDGGFIIVGGSSRIVCGTFNPPSPETPGLTRLSSTGDVLWVRDYDMRISAVVQNRDGGFSAVSDRGVIVNLDSDGIVKNKSNPGIQRIGPEEWERIDTFTALENGGFLLAGETIARIDTAGNVSWQILNGTIIDRAFSVIEMKNQEGYLVVIYSNVQGPVVLHLDLNGSIVRTIPIGSFDYSLRPVIQRTDDGYSILSVNSPSCAAVHLDNKGKDIDTVNLAGASPLTFLPMKDGSFVSYGIVSPGNIVKKTIINSNGTIVREEKNECSAKECPNTLSSPSLITSDSGFATMMRIEKQLAC